MIKVTVVKETHWAIEKLKRVFAWNWKREQFGETKIWKKYHTLLRPKKKKNQNKTKTPALRTGDDDTGWIWGREGQAIVSEGRVGFPVMFRVFCSTITIWIFFCHYSSWFFLLSIIWLCSIISFYLAQSPFGLENGKVLILSLASRVIPQYTLGNN